MKRNPQKQKKSPKRKPKETLEEKVRRHLTDKTDVITDEDIRDAVVGAEGPVQAENPDEEIPKNKKTTPWDIMSEGYGEEA